MRQNPTHAAAPVLNEDGSVPMDGSGDFEVISRRGRPRGPRASRRPVPARPRFSRPSIAPLPPAAAPALPMSLPNHDAVQYAEQVRGPPPAPVTSGHFHDDSRRMFPLLPPAAAAFGASFGGHRHGGGGNPFQTNSPSSSSFPPHLRPEDGRPRDDCRTTAASFSSSPSLYLPAVHSMEMSLQESSDGAAADDRRCRSYSPSTFEHHLVVRPSAQSQAAVSVSGGVLAPSSVYDDRGVHAVASPPMPEPEPALCGDLPLDLTAKARTDDDHPRPLTEAPEVGVRSPPDDVTAYRPRRHYETWKQQGSLPREPDSRRDSDVSTAASDANTEVGTAAHLQPEPEPEMVVEREPTTETAAGPPAKRSRLSTEEEERVTEVATGSPASGADSGVAGGRYQCSHCEIEFFGSRVLHAMHMAFHGPVDPFQCSQCGVRTADRVQFFLHLARAAHA